MPKRFGHKAVSKAGKDAEKSLRLDETGKLHPFYAFKPLKEMPGQEAYFHSEARVQAFIAGGKTGKTTTLHQKLRCVALGYDPSRPDYKYPFDDKYKINLWLICPPDMVEKELQDLARGFPRDVKKKVYRSSGHQRIEGEPMPGRPLGWSIYVKSRQKPIEEFQYDVCHVVAYDEQPPEEIWNECAQRLIMTQGWIMISLTPVLGLTWLHTKLRKLSKPYQNLTSGEFGWYTATQYENPHIPKGEIEFFSRDMSETEHAIRVLGEYRLLAGSAFFDAEVLRLQRQNFAKEPEHALSFEINKRGSFSAFDPKRKAWRVWSKPEAGRAYVIGADVAAGKGGDYSVAQVIDAETGEQVATYRDRWIEPVDFAIEVGLAGLLYNTAYLFPEINSDGAAVLHALRKVLVYPRLLRRASYGGRMDDMENTYGWMTGKHNKRAALQELFAGLRNGSQGKIGVLVHDEVTIDELASFGHLNENKPGAYGLGALEGHDDCVMALAIAYQGVGQVPVQYTKRDNRNYTVSRAHAKIEAMFERQQKRQNRTDMLLVDR